MSSFIALVTEDVQANRLLSLSGGNGVPEISITAAGGTPDFRSNGDIEADTKVNVTLKNNPVWDVEAGEDLSAGAYVEVGENGVIVASDDTGIGYVAEAVEAGEVAKLIRKVSGERGPQGPPGADGSDGFGTEEQYNDIIARLEELEG